MNKTEIINLRITKKEKEFMKNRCISPTRIFTDALNKEMILSREGIEERMMEKISNALGVKVVDLSFLASTNDSQKVQFRYVLKEV